MTIKTLPAALEARPCAGIQCDLSPKALNAWNPGLHAASDTANSISIYDPIGADFFGDGVTAKRIAGALRSMAPDAEVTVNINSPGGDVFEGLAIYNLLREHKGRVVVNVMGLAASAASFIAMAGDEIRIGRAAFLMVHNAWIVAMGNRNDLRELADWLEPFDSTIADIYAARTGIPIDTITAQLDGETWIGGREAVESGWAESLLDSDEVEEDTQTTSRMAAKAVDVALAKAGMSRSQRRELVNELKSSTPSAAGGGTPSATATDTPSAVVIDAEPTMRITFDLAQGITQ